MNSPMPKKKLLVLSDRAAELLPQLAGRYHDQGAFVSRLIEDEAARRDRAATIEQGDLASLRTVARELLQEVELLKRRGSPG